MKKRPTDSGHIKGMNAMGFFTADQIAEEFGLDEAGMKGVYNKRWRPADVFVNGRYRYFSMEAATKFYDPPEAKVETVSRMIVVPDDALQKVILPEGYAIVKLEDLKFLAQAADPAKLIGDKPPSGFVGGIRGDLKVQNGSGKV